MKCEVCGSDIKNIPAGVSKKSGKPYNAFQVCSNRECNYKPITEDGHIREVRQSPLPLAPKKTEEDPFIEGKEKNTRLMCRSDLMGKVIEAFGHLGGFNPQETINTFKTLWEEVEK